MGNRTKSIQRTMRLLRQEGCICGVVEKFNPYAGKFGHREDLFGFIDVISLHPKGICGVQACGSDFQGHVRKILANEIAPEWLKSGGTIELWGWRKILKVRGGKLKVWKPRKQTFTLEDFNV